MKTYFVEDSDGKTFLVRADRFRDYASHIRFFLDGSGDPVADFYMPRNVWDSALVSGPRQESPPPVSQLSDAEIDELGHALYNSRHGIDRWLTTGEAVRALYRRQASSVALRLLELRRGDS